MMQLYYNDPKPNIESLLKLLDGRKLVDKHCVDMTYNADAVVITLDDSKGTNESFRPSWHVTQAN